MAPVATRAVLDPLRSAPLLVIDPTAIISRLADIEDSVRGSRLLIDGRVRIDSFVKIKCTGGAGDLHIGEGSYLNSGVVIYTGNGVEIGKHVLVGPNCVFAPVNHEYRSRDRLIVEQRFGPSKGGIQVEDDVWLGAGTVILDGVRIGRGAVIGATSLVRQSVDAYGVYVGNPLRKIGERT